MTADAEGYGGIADGIAEIIAKADAGDDPDLTQEGRAFLAGAEKAYRKLATESKTSAGRATVTGM